MLNQKLRSEFGLFFSCFYLFVVRRCFVPVISSLLRLQMIPGRVIPSIMILVSPLVGCWTEKLPDDVSWFDHVAPMVAEKCVACHNSEGIAPINLFDFDEVKSNAALIEMSVLRGSMPPQRFASSADCANSAPFVHNPQLSDYDMALFSAWVDGGFNKGNTPTEDWLPISTRLGIENPDRQLHLTNPLSIEGKRDRFVCVVLDPVIDEDVWLTGVDIIPGNSKETVSAQLFLDEQNQSANLVNEQGWYECFGDSGIYAAPIISTWAPDTGATVFPAQSGMPISPGAKMVLKMHYRPSADVLEDTDTRIDLQWTTSQPARINRIFALGNLTEEDQAFAGGDGYGLVTAPFLVPVGAEDHVETYKILIPGGDVPLIRNLPVRLHAIGTHMLYAGTDMKISLIRAGTQEEECLMYTPGRSLDWQGLFSLDVDFDSMPEIYPGDTVVLRCRYNNSYDNQALLSAFGALGETNLRDMVLGAEPVNEMCVGVFGVIISPLVNSVLPW